MPKKPTRPTSKLHPAGLIKGAGIPTGRRATTFVACGQCGAFHRTDFHGDCREDSERFAEIPEGGILLEEEEEANPLDGVDLPLLRQQSDHLAEMADYLRQDAREPAWQEAIEGIQNLIAGILAGRPLSTAAWLPPADPGPPPVTSIESQVYIDGGDQALKDYRAELAKGTRTLWLVYEEDDASRQDTSILSAHWTEAEALAAVKSQEDSALEEGEQVHGREEDWTAEDADDADWSKCYEHTSVTIPWPPPEWAELFAGIVRVNRLLEEALNLLPPEPEEPEPEMVRHTACRHCNQDIEGIRPAPGAPYPAGEWRDRGNNTTCPNDAGDAGQKHEPV